MFESGSESWRLTVDDNSNLLQVALYVRDACGLDVTVDHSIPPRLLGTVVDHRDDLTAQIRQSAGEQWMAWWQTIIALVGAQELGTLQLPSEPFERLEAMTAVHESLLDWPELDGFGDRPALREAVRVSYEDATRWLSQRARGAVRGRRMRATYDGATLGSIVRALVERLGVEPGRLRAAVLVVGVEGDWSSLVAPGVLVCSESVTVAPARFAALVESAFVSGLDAIEVRPPTLGRTRRPLPASALRESLVLWSAAEIELVCERIIAYSDGFEIELRRRGATPPPAAVPKDGAHHLEGPNEPSKRTDNFAGIEVGLHFADGREVQVTNLADPGPGGEIVLSRFWRDEPDLDSLWLWAMPLPPVGTFTLSVRWPDFGIEAAGAEFEGGLVRPA